VHDDAVLLYGKTTEDRGNSILVAVCLDPHNPHEADIDVPLYDFGLADGHSFDVAELLSGERHTWTGSRQRIRLTPDDPAAIYRITP
jgi:starch synthase (maltosyl-transferring)